MSAPSKYEERKLIFNLSDLVRRALKQGAIPMQINASPDLVRKFEKVIYARLLPPRGPADDKRPWLKLDDAPALPFMADRGLKPMHAVLITNKTLEGGVAVDLSNLILPGPPKQKRVAVVEERVDKAAAAEQTRSAGIWSEVKDRMKGFFK